MTECKSTCSGGCTRNNVKEGETLYKLNYFNGRGRAELTRLIFAVYGKSFEDHRINHSEWPGDEKQKTPLGQLPYLEVNFHVHIPQSIAIARLIAKRANLYGDSDLEQAKTDAVVDTVSDLTNAMAQSLYYAEDKEASKKKLIEETAPQHLKRLETIISLYGTSGHSVGSSLKWSDLAIFDVIQKVEAVDASLINDSHPNIKAVKKTVESHEKIAEYLKKRPETPF